MCASKTTTTHKPKPVSELFAAMRSSGRYGDDDEIADTIEQMKEDVAAGEDPEEVLHQEGFEPDYVFDILEW